MKSDTDISLRIAKIMTSVQLEQIVSCIDNTSLAITHASKRC